MRWTSTPVCQRPALGFCGRQRERFLEGARVGLTPLPWIDQPLVLLDTEDIEAARTRLIQAGTTPRGEIADGSLAPLGTAPITNGDPGTGIVDVPGSRLAVVRLADGVTPGRRQSLPTP